LPSPSGRRGTALAVDEVESAWIYITFYLNEKRPHPARSSPPSPTGEGFLGKRKNDLIRFA